MKRDGGPAFPRPASENTEGGTLHDGNYMVPEHDGMSLRDWFAGQAMAGWFGSYGPEHDHPATGGYALTVARHAYAMADAMIEARDEVPS